MSEVRIRPRDGFTLIEVLIVLILMGIVIGMVAPRLTRGLEQTRAQRAASVVAADLQLAHSMAARQRRPVQVNVNAGQRRIRVQDYTGATVYNERLLTSEFGISSMTTSQAGIVVYPTGLASNGITIGVTAGRTTRSVAMTKAGQIRIKAP
jgi:type II secretion system protein H